MIVSDLKKSILRSIFTGGSDTNNINDSDAKILIEEIIAKQQELIKSKAIKVGKFSNKINKEELPKIPSNWEYVKIGSISKLVTKQTGFDYSKNIKPLLIKEHLDNYVPLIQTRDFKDKDFNFDTVYYAPKSLTEKFPNITLNKKALLLSIVGASIGNVGLYLDNTVCLLGGAIAKIDLVDDRLYEYLYLYLKSPLGYEQIMKNYKSTAQGTITVEDVRNIVVPLPPIEEQERIISKINQLFSKLDEVQPLEEKLKAMKEQFPNDMRKSVLKKCFDLDCNSDELVNLCDIYTGNSISESTKKTKYSNLDEGYNYIATKDVNFDHSIDYDNGIKIPFNESKFKYADVNDILLCIEGGSAGRKIGILNEKVCFGNKLCKFSPLNEKLNNKYLYYFLQSPQFLLNFNDNLSGIIGGVSINKIKKIRIPLPSIDEQKNIVEKLEKILPLCDDITGLVSEV